MSKRQNSWIKYLSFMICVVLFLAPGMKIYGGMITDRGNVLERIRVKKTVSINTVIYLDQEAKEQKDALDTINGKTISANMVEERVKNLKQYLKKESEYRFLGWKYGSGISGNEIDLSETLSVSENGYVYGEWEKLNPSTDEGEGKKDPETQQKDPVDDKKVTPTDKKDPVTDKKDAEKEKETTKKTKEFTVSYDLNGLTLGDNKVEEGETWKIKEKGTLEEPVKALNKVKPKNSSTKLANKKKTDVLLGWIDESGQLVTGKTEVTKDTKLTAVWVRFTVNYSKNGAVLKATMKGAASPALGKTSCKVKEKQKNNSKTTVNLVFSQGKKKSITKKMGKLVKGEKYTITVSYKSAEGKVSAKKKVTFEYKPLPPAKFVISNYDANALKVPFDIKWKSENQYDGWELYQSTTGKARNLSSIVNVTVYVDHVNIGRKTAQKGNLYGIKTYFVNRSGKKVYSDWSDLVKVKK